LYKQQISFCKVTGNPAEATMLHAYL